MPGTFKAKITIVTNQSSNIGHNNMVNISSVLSTFPVRILYIMIGRCNYRGRSKVDHRLSVEINMNHSCFIEGKSSG